MTEEQVNVIRESSRNLLVLNRRKQRDEENDLRRSMINLRTTPNTVVYVANKLKTKSTVSVPELQTLKNALIDDAKNIEVVLNTHGALRGLVRELSGHDIKKQCAAAGCFCNLALGDSKAGVTVSKAAGAYLVTALDNLTTELAVTCAWTVGNLAGCGTRACELLAAQGAVAKLTELLETSIYDTREAAVYALEHFAFQLRDDLRNDHLNKILGSLARVDIESSSRLLFILSCHKDFSPLNIPEDYIRKLIKILIVSINKHLSNKDTQLLYLLRIFANMNCVQIYNVILSDLLNNNMVGSVGMLFNKEGVNESLFWLLGNMLQCCREHLFFKQLS